MTNLEKYNKVFTEVFECEHEALGVKFTSTDVAEWDSIIQMTLISALEDEFDIMLDTDDILEFDSFEQGKIILAKYDIAI